MLASASLFHIVAEGANQAFFDSHYEAVKGLEVIALGLGMKVIVGVLHSLLVAQVKLFFKCLSQPVLNFSVFLKKIDADNEAVVVDKVSEVLVEGWGCGLMVSLQRGLRLEALLLPEEGYRATDLDERVDLVPIDEELLSLHEVGNIAIVI